MTLVINVFISFNRSSFNRNSFHRSSFHRNNYPNEIVDDGRFIPAEADIMLSALEPFRNSQTVRVRVYDLETTGGRLRGLLNGISESPAVIIAGERHVGMVAVNDSLARLLNEVQIRQTVT